jgi:cytochrome c551/c552
MNRLLCALMLAAIVGCESASEQSAAEITGGNPKHGPQAIQRYGCGACHTIKGVDGATALVGPPLSKLGARM